MSYPDSYSHHESSIKCSSLKAVPGDPSGHSQSRKLLPNRTPLSVLAIAIFPMVTNFCKMSAGPSVSAPFFKRYIKENMITFLLRSVDRP